jgi:hypothetical protein
VKKDTSAVVSGEKIWPLSGITHIWNPNNVASYDADTQTLTTDTYGFSGWQNESGWDLSSYSSIEITLQEASTAGVQWRMYDENNYFANKFSKTEFGDATKITIDLNGIQKMTDLGADAEDFDASKVYIVGFWSYGGSPIKIQSIKLIRAVADGIQNIANDVVITNDAPVYNLMGMKVGVVGNFDSLPKGIYVVNGKKILKR